MFSSILLLCSQVYAFELIFDEKDNAYHWEKETITFHYSHEGAPDHLDEESALAAITAAANAWSTIEGADIDLAINQDVQPEALDRDDNFNMIFWSQDWPGDEELLAITSLWASDYGTVRGFDMILHYEKPWQIGQDEEAFDFENAMAHEFGHVLAFSHPDVNEATMHGSTALGEITKRDLHWDDEEAVRFMYPPRSNRGVFGCSTAPLSSALWVWLPIGLLGLARRERSRCEPPR
jgi:hypothetical protein